jgi:hypothetical protein
MKNSKLYTSAKGAILAISTLFALSGNLRFSSPNTLYVSTTGGGCKAATIVSSSVFTTGGYGYQLTMKTAGGINTRSVWGTSNCAVGAKPVHFHG